MDKIELKDYALLDKNEHEKLLEIRNRDFIRRVSLDNKIIELDEHLNFVEKLKTSQNKYFVVLVKGEIVGGVNIFNINADIKWGVFFCDKASLLVKTMSCIYLIDFIFKRYNKEYLYLDVKKDNTNAISFDENLGFSFEKEEENVITMKMSNDTFEKKKESILLKRVVKKMQSYKFELKEYDGKED